MWYLLPDALQNLPSWFLLTKDANCSDNSMHQASHPILDDDDDDADNGDDDEVDAIISS